ncbi:glycoside hydrolase family 32 protein [Metabacillus niabensis]|uniref:glycoside hydrolase family 32 protein n=1 Tax=Metabacillus niabensis TaxID=324854 RepID=UPI0039AED726
MQKHKKIGFLLICFLIVGVIVFVMNVKKDTPSQTNKKDTETSSIRAHYHFTVPDKWKNDPQRPLYVNGKYHYYYLYNRDYPDGNGTEWRHASSEDLVHWQDEGVAIPKYTTENGDPWSGSVVIDSENTAGFGEGAFVAIVTQPSADGEKQEQFLWYSTDKGQTFTPYGDKPIMENPGTHDFRDPKVMWDKRDEKWKMVMAEGAKIGFYESKNLINWEYTSGFTTGGMGIVECPDLYLMQADDGALKWVLGVSANGLSTNKPNTYAYWIGDFNGKEFIAEQNDPQWLDYGFDWYGGVTFEDGTEKDNLTRRYAFAWMNNWAYAHNTPTLQEDFNGMDSIVRQIELKHEGDNHYYLASQPIEALNKLETTTESIKNINVNGTKTLPLKGDVYQLEADISWEKLKNVGLRLRESADKKKHVDVGIFYNPKQPYFYVNRSNTDHPDENQQLVESTSPFNTNKKQVHLKILVDTTSIEVFIDDGKEVHSQVIFPEEKAQGISLFSEGGEAVFSNLTFTNMKPANH